MPKDLLNGLSERPHAAIFVSAIPAEKVIDAARDMAGRPDLLIVINEHKGIVGRLLPAYLNAYLRYREGIMHSKSVSLETMLFIAGTMNIGNAMERISASGNRFIVFSSSRKLAESLAARCKLKKARVINLWLDPDIANDVAVTAIRDDK